MAARVPALVRLMLVLFGVSFALPAHAAPTIVADPFPPARFHSLYIERDEKGVSTVIRITGDAVLYRVTTGKTVTDEATVHPSADDWFQFIQGLNAAKVYKWAPKFYYPGQGGTWVIDLAMEDRKFNSEGTNEYPRDGDESQGQANPASGPSVPFQLFWQAVLKLAGKAPAK